MQQGFFWNIGNISTLDYVGPQSAIDRSFGSWTSFLRMKSFQIFMQITR